MTDFLLLSSAAAATLNYRASLNSAADKPSPVPTSTGNNTIVLSFVLYCWFSCLGSAGLILYHRLFWIQRCISGCNEHYFYPATLLPLWIRSFVMLTFTCKKLIGNLGEEMHLLPQENLDRLGFSTTLPQSWKMDFVYVILITMVFNSTKMF